MAAVAQSQFSKRGTTVTSEQIVGPNTTTVYFADIPQLTGDLSRANKYATFACYKSNALVGTSVRLNLYVSPDGGTTKHLVKDVFGANIGASAAFTIATIDLNAFPGGQYFIGVTSNGNDSNGDCLLYVYV